MHPVLGLTTLVISWQAHVLCDGVGVFASPTAGICSNANEQFQKFSQRT